MFTFHLFVLFLLFLLFHIFQKLLEEAVAVLESVAHPSPNNCSSGTASSNSSNSSNSSSTSSSTKSNSTTTDCSSPPAATDLCVATDLSLSVELSAAYHSLGKVLLSLSHSLPVFACFVPNLNSIPLSHHSLMNLPPPPLAP